MKNRSLIAIALFIAMMFTCSFGISATAAYQEQPKQVEKLLAGIRCKGNTSCPDQLSKAITEYKTGKTAEN